MPTKAEPNEPTSTRQLAHKLGLVIVASKTLTVRRERHGKGFSYRDAKGNLIGNRKEISRLASLAVPPAYEDVRFSPNPNAHLQAVGRDAAGRTQYRYHPDWTKVRETRKAERLAQFVGALPRIRRTIAYHLSTDDVTREFSLAAVIELVAHSAIRAGNEEYAKERGTRGATTLLKSNVRVNGGKIALRFRAKGGKNFQREIDAPRLAGAIDMLLQLPGKRLFQYRVPDGGLRAVRAQEANQFLRDIAGIAITLKDFRTLCASAAVLEALSKQEPAELERGRKKQVLEAVRNAAEELANTPTVCRNSYVHEAVVQAFENGVLEDYAEALKSARSPAKAEKILAEVVAG